MSSSRRRSETERRRGVGAFVAFSPLWRSFFLRETCSTERSDVHVTVCFVLAPPTCPFRGALVLVSRHSSGGAPLFRLLSPVKIVAVAVMLMLAERCSTLFTER